MAAPAAGATSTGSVRPARVAGRLGSEEFHSATLPTAQEAAVLYSANYVDAAAYLLKTEVRDPVGRNNKQAWIMLFDLYQETRNRVEFDALSMLFTVKFEQSPPVWAENGDAASDPRRHQNRERKDFFGLKPSAGGELAVEIEKFLAFAESQGTVRLDVAKVTAISTNEALLLANALTHLRKKQLPMWFNNFDGFEKVLRAAINEKSAQEQRPYWMLLFEIYILQGRSQDFEDLGLEFAVAFEISPPSWEVYVNKISADTAKPAATKGGATPPAPEAVFELKGVLSAASANQIAEFSVYAASRTEVPVDMSRVLRVEFAYAAAFFDVVKAIQLAGKRVILTNLNELNAGLLETMGVNRYAILVRRKS